MFAERPVSYIYTAYSEVKQVKQNEWNGLIIYLQKTNFLLKIPF